MRIELSEERKGLLINAVQQLFLEEFERGISVFQAERLLDFLLAQLGPSVYNQAVQDARAYIQLKLDDLDGEVYEAEPPL